MKSKFSKLVLALGFAVTASAPVFAQESKLKIEDKNYELKVKREGDELKIKEKGKRPSTERQSYTIKRGETVTTVKEGTRPKEPVAQAKKPVAKKSVAGRKCNCKTASKSTAAKKRTTAYRSPATVKKTTTARPKTAATAAASPVIVRDTVFMVRVDTVFGMNERSSFTGNRSSYLFDNYKKMKVERDDDGITIKKEYHDGREIKKTFRTEEEFNTYMQWKNY